MTRLDIVTAGGDEERSASRQLVPSTYNNRSRECSVSALRCRLVNLGNFLPAQARPLQRLRATLPPTRAHAYGRKPSLTRPSVPFLDCSRGSQPSLAQKLRATAGTPVREALWAFLTPPAPYASLVRHGLPCRLNATDTHAAASPSAKGSATVGLYIGLRMFLHGCVLEITLGSTAFFLYSSSFTEASPYRSGNNSSRTAEPRINALIRGQSDIQQWRRQRRAIFALRAGNIPP